MILSFDNICACGEVKDVPPNGDKNTCSSLAIKTLQLCNTSAGRSMSDWSEIKTEDRQTKSVRMRRRLSANS